MRTLFDSAGRSPVGIDLDDTQLATAYGWPDQPWLRANMVSTIDGAAYAPGGKSRGISTEADRALFLLLRASADVIVVGAGTARDEGYRPARVRPEHAHLRTGRAPVPVVALVTRSLTLDLDTPLFDAAGTLVVTCAATDPERRAEISQHAEVLVCGDDSVDLIAMRTALAARGLTRMHCEGGPTLLGAVSAEGALDELLLTVSPYLAGGSYVDDDTPRVLAGPHLPDAPQSMQLQHVLTSDGAMFLRYTTGVD